MKGWLAATLQWIIDKVEGDVCEKQKPLSILMYFLTQWIKVLRGHARFIIVIVLVRTYISHIVDCIFL